MTIQNSSTLPAALTLPGLAQPLILQPKNAVKIPTEGDLLLTVMPLSGSGERRQGRKRVYHVVLGGSYRLNTAPESEIVLVYVTEKRESSIILEYWQVYQDGALLTALQHPICDEASISDAFAKRKRRSRVFDAFFDPFAAHPLRFLLLIAFCIYTGFDDGWGFAAILAAALIVLFWLGDWAFGAVIDKVISKLFKRKQTTPEKPMRFLYTKDEDYLNQENLLLFFATAKHKKVWVDGMPPRGAHR